MEEIVQHVFYNFEGESRWATHKKNIAPSGMERGTSKTRMQRGNMTYFNYEKDTSSKLSDDVKIAV